MRSPLAFGPGADAVAAELGDVPAFVVAHNAMLNAYFAMADARRAGQAFAAMFLIPDRRSFLAYEIVPQLLVNRSYDDARATFDALASGKLVVNGQSVEEVSAQRPEVWVTLKDLSRIPDAFIVRSWTEAAAHNALRGYTPPYVARWYPARDLGAWKKSDRRDLVIVWAPTYPAELCAIHAFALHESRMPVVVICNGGNDIVTRARYVDIRSAEVPALLARALCVVDTSIDDPSWTQAFAARELSIAASTTSGAHEVADGVAFYEPWSYRSIAAAVAEAVGRRASFARESPPSIGVIRRALENAGPRPVQNQPLVTVAVPTYNRRDDLVRILKKILEQTYTNFEIIVVNDGGEAVADVASLDPRITVFDREPNEGPSAVLNFALEHARGKYFCGNADDDEMYPDHLMRVVEALERTNADVAHSNILVRFEQPGNGCYRTTGYNCSIFCFPIDRSEVYAMSPVAGQGLFMRVEALRRIGGWDVTNVVADQEIQIRLAEASDFVHVAHVTGEWLQRKSADQLSQKWQKDVVGDLKRVYERHPAEGRPYIAAFREGVLQHVATRPGGDELVRPIVELVDG